MASVKDLTPFGIDLTSCRHISEADFATLVRQGCKPERGDVLVAKDGATALDAVCEIKHSIDVVLLSSVAILRPNPTEVTSAYLRYFLDSEATKRYMKGNFVTGAAIPRVVLQDFKRCKIALPPLPTQRKIAAILSAYDDLIENNTRRIAILEQMAQALYREWFVDFRFPGHEQHRMVESPLGAIPEGWEVVPIGMVYSGLYDGPHATPRPSLDGPVFLGIKNMTEDGKLDMTEVRHIAEVDFSVWTRRVLPQAGDIVFTYEAALHRYGMIPKRFRGCLGRRVALIRPNSERAASHYLLRYFLSERWHRMVSQHVILGATVDRLPLTELPSFEMLLPPIAIQRQADAILSVFGELMDNCLARCTELRRMRDLQLPKLIAGEVDVECVNIQTGN
jgi:type I restriction enzyme S subunit